MEIHIALSISSAKIQLENKKGATALDIAFAYADPRIIEIVQKRWDQLPPPIDKRKKGGKGMVPFLCQK